MEHLRRNTIGVLVLLVPSLVATCRWAEAQQTRPGVQYLLYARSHVQFGVHSGRIGVAALKRNSFMPQPVDQEGRKERVAVHYNHRDGSSRFSYDLASPTQKLTISAGTNGQVTIRREPGEEGETVPSEFLQKASGPLTLTFGKGAEKKTFTAATIWHLLLAHREACKRYLLPSLQILRPNWKLLDAADAVEQELLRAAAGGNLPDQRRWAKLVAQLGDDRYTRREAADRQLRALGQPVVAYLRSLRRDRLDAEQRYRIHRILRSLNDTRGDESPSQVASAMLGDPTIWLILLERDSLSTRRVAAKHLGRLLEGPIDFDPAADATTRGKQIEALRRKTVGSGQ